MEVIKNEKLCKKLTAVIGINEGYFHENEESNINTFCNTVIELQKKIFDATGVLIPIVVSESRTCYLKEFGCPENGEVTFTLETSEDPEFPCTHKLGFEIIAEGLIIDVAKYFKQSTVKITVEEIPVVHKIKLSYDA